MNQSDISEPKSGTNFELASLLRPKSIALVGASSSPGSLGQTVLANIENSDFRGELYLVNPKRPTINGKECFGSIEEMPKGIDCAVLAIPAAAVLPAIRECVVRAVKTAIIFSAGFAEAGEEGRATQREIAKIAKEAGMVIEGPNCLGMVNYVDGLPLTFIVTPPQAPTDQAGVAIISQSGALAAVLAVNMRHHGIPLSYSVSTGNEAVNGAEDFVEYFIADEMTRVIALVIEQFRAPKRFLSLAASARRAGKSLVLLHPGRSRAARVSAVTHTGAIAGDYEVMKSLVKHAGVFHVESMEELTDVTQLLVRCKRLPRGGAAVFTESGAFKAHTLDLCDQVGLELPALSAQSETALRQELPSFISPSNPLDLTAQALVDPSLYRRTIAPFLEDPAFGSVLLAIILTDPKTTQLKLPPIVEALEHLKSDKPVIFAALDEGAPFDFPELERLRRLGVACFPSPERAIRALANVSNSPAISETRKTEQSFRSFDFSARNGVLSELESKQCLAEIGIKVPLGGIAHKPNDALLIASAIGFPVVLKAHSSLLAHKTEAGGVLLNIGSETELEQAWAQLHENVRRERPDIEMDGVLVESMSEPGIELILGARNDPDWGSVVMIGFGGVLAEAVGDYRLISPDLSKPEIEKEVIQLRCNKLLRGFRGNHAADVSAVASAISTVGRLVVEHPEISEIDINPLVVYEEGKGVIALDAVISLNGAGHRRETGCLAVVQDDSQF